MILRDNDTKLKNESRVCGTREVNLEVTSNTLEPQSCRITYVHCVLSIHCYWQSRQLFCSVLQGVCVCVGEGGGGELMLKSGF